MRLKAQEIEQWTPFRKLSGKLQQQVKKYQRYVWREIKGVDVENLLNNLPKDLRRNIMRELCLDLLKKVSSLSFVMLTIPGVVRIVLLIFIKIFFFFFP